MLLYNEVFHETFVKYLMLVQSVCQTLQVQTEAFLILCVTDGFRIIVIELFFMISTGLTLPCGAILKNRLVKSAMTERISNNRFEPTKGHEKLYEDWACTGAGLLITGNVVIDRKHLESSGNVCFHDEKMLPKLISQADTGKRQGNHIWVQISHSGRQTSKFNVNHPLAPSAVQLKKLGLFGTPKEMIEEDILDVIQRFVKAANLSKLAGFTGVQIHVAHGYLLSQFLSHNTNIRLDCWGGSIENRSLLLGMIIREVRKVRKVVGTSFPISVKLNSADFQRGDLRSSLHWK
ncbi:oxidoreductase [Aquimarina sp. M1]